MKKWDAWLIKTWLIIWVRNETYNLEFLMQQQWPQSLSLIWLTVSSSVLYCILCATNITYTKWQNSYSVSYNRHMLYNHKSILHNCTFYNFMFKLQLTDYHIVKFILATCTPMSALSLWRGIKILNTKRLLLRKCTDTSKWIIW